MNRLQKKCVIASTGVHLLLVLILVIGPAFASSKSKPDDMPILDFVPLKTVDALVSGGGERNAKPPVAAPIPQPLAPQPQAQPLPEKQRPADPPKQSSPPKPDPDALVSNERKKPEISLKLVSRNKDTNDSKTKADSKARE